MTPRELASAVRPLEEQARAVLRFSQIAKDAIQLDSRVAAAQREWATLREQITAGQARLAALEGDMAAATDALAAERAAAVAATERAQAAILETTAAQIRQAQATLAGWQTRTREAESAHGARMAALQNDEAALRVHVDGLRELARRMAQAAEAVPR